VGLMMIAWVDPSRKSAPVPMSARAAKTELQPAAAAAAMTTLTALHNRAFDIRPPLSGHVSYITLPGIRIRRTQIDYI
jgi:hypothetical protein